MTADPDTHRARHRPRYCGEPPGSLIAAIAAPAVLRGQSRSRRPSARNAIGEATHRGDRPVERVDRGLQSVGGGRQRLHRGCEATQDFGGFGELFERSVLATSSLSITPSSTSIRSRMPSSASSRSASPPGARIRSNVELLPPETRSSNPRARSTGRQPHPDASACPPARRGPGHAPSPCRSPVNSATRLAPMIAPRSGKRSVIGSTGFVSSSPRGVSPPRARSPPRRVRRPRPRLLP